MAWREDVAGKTCFNCGTQAFYRDDATGSWVCDAQECDREIFNAHEEMRQVEHDEVDRSWGRY